MRKPWDEKKFKKDYKGVQVSEDKEGTFVFRAWRGKRNGISPPVLRVEPRDRKMLPGTPGFANWHKQATAKFDQLAETDPQALADVIAKYQTSGEYKLLAALIGSPQR